MARYEKKPEHKFSRVKNHLAELQKWWPVYIKNDTDLGISIDPVLFKSQFSSFQNDKDIIDESTTAGVRVEAINPDGTDITGTEPTITISGSGTYNPRCRITHSDGSFTEFLMIAPTVEQSSNQATYLSNDDAKEVINTGSNTGDLQAWTTATPAGQDSMQTGNLGLAKGNAMVKGPYPVFMTIQEFVEQIDSYRHIGIMDSEKRAFLPFGLGSTGRMPIVNIDPRVSGDVAFPVAETYRATVFMPMLLDSNQLAKNITGATNVVGKSRAYAKNGITRYNQNPLEKHTDVKYKYNGSSGDFKLDRELLLQPLNQRTKNLPVDSLYPQGTTTNPDLLDGMGAQYLDKSNSHFGAPSYRMSMALACFLKDGTYSLNNGTIIPYSYDSRRYIGGTQTTSLYAVWDGGRGWGDDESGGGHDASYDKFADGSPAGIYPYFDFIQGPVSPSAQGTNWNYNQVRNTKRPPNDSSYYGVVTHDVDMNPTHARPQNVLEYTVDAKKGSYGIGHVPPNPRPIKVVAVEWNGPQNEVAFWTYLGFDSSPNPDIDNYHSLIQAGVPIFVENVDLTNSGNTYFSGNNGVTSGRYSKTALPAKQTSRVTYERLGTTQTGTGFSNVSSVVQAFQFNGWFLHRRMEIHGINMLGVTGAYQTNPATSPITPDSIVAGCAAEHFGGDNTGRRFVKYVVQIPPYMNRDNTISIRTSNITLLTPKTSSLKVGRNHGKLKGIKVRYTGNDGTTTQWVWPDAGKAQPTFFTEEINQLYPATFPQTSADRMGIGLSFNPFGDFGDLIIDTDTTTNPMTAFQTIGNIMNQFQIGMGTIDSNVPSSSSLEDTMGGRPKFTGVELPNQDSTFEGVGIVPRSIQIETINSNNNTGIGNAPMVSGKGAGSLRIPAPLGHDLSQRYNTIGLSGTVDDTTTPTNDQPLAWKSIDSSSFHAPNKWIPRGDLMGHCVSVIPDKWAFRGVSTPLWSYIDSATGSHAWDYVKPEKVGTGGLWDFGRNRPFPAHEREGTRLSMTPALNSYSLGFNDGTTVHHVKAGQETTLIGLSETGCSPIHLDMEMTAYIPEVDNRMFIIEFDQNENDPQYGRHSWIGNTFTRDAGWGFHPVSQSHIRNPPTRINSYVNKDKTTIDDGTYITPDVQKDAGHELFVSPPSSNAAGATGNLIATRLKQANLSAFGGVGNIAAAGYPYSIFAMPNTPRKVAGFGSPNPLAYDGVFERTAIWFMSANTHFTGGTYFNSSPFSLGGKAGMGRITANQLGQNTDYTEGVQLIRASFTNSEMIFSLNGTEVSRATNSNGEVWGVSIKSCNLFSFVNREPFVIAPVLQETQATKGIGSPYIKFRNEEPVGMGKSRISTVGVSPNAENKAVYELAGNPTEQTWFGYSRRQSYGGTGNFDEFYYLPRMMPEHYSNMIGDKEIPVSYSTPALAQSNKDVQIDELTFRHLPTPAMLPFTVDTTVMLPPTGTIIGKYNAIQIYATNIDLSRNKNITVSLFEKPTLPNICQIAREATVPIPDFQDLDPFFIQDIGTIDLNNLPTTYITNGFVIRFNFYMPSTEDSELHPVNFKELPTITKWELLFDHKPTSNVAVIGNTFNGQTATTVGQSVSPTITTKVGHIVSARIFGDTIDPDRKISEVKIDFGDGTDSGFLPIPVPALNVSLDISHVYSSTPTSPATFYEMKAQSKDDAGNISDLSLSIKVQVNGAEPVSILRAIPTLVRAGQSIRFDGSQSYTLNTEATISNYTFDFGDGSSTVSGAQTFQDHTYAVAGEYQATLIVTDSASNVSPVTSCVIKVLPATTIVPLRLQTKPSSFSRTRRANLTQTAVLDSIYPEISDTGQRADEFNLRGMFLKGTQDRDIQYMEELLLSGSLVEIEWQEVNFDGIPDSKTFIGRIVSFDYNRQGGSIDSTPYTATFIRESGLGV